jgi:ribosomal protein S18 acetylase RimI-like enzyme
MITLRVYRDNSAAVAIYSSLGFAEVPADSNANAMAMEKKANQALRNEPSFTGMALR